MAVEVLFQAPTTALVEQLAGSMRTQDKLEVRRQGYATPLQALIASLRASDIAVACTFDGQPAAIFGAYATARAGALGEPLEGAVWALTGSAVDAHPRAYLRASKQLVAAALAFCPLLRCAIDAEHAPALRWARWAGFTVAERVHLPPYGFPFVWHEARR